MMVRVAVKMEAQNEKKKNNNNKESTAKKERKKMKGGRNWEGNERNGGSKRK